MTLVAYRGGPLDGTLVDIEGSSSATYGRDGAGRSWLIEYAHVQECVRRSRACPDVAVLRVVIAELTPLGKRRWNRIRKGPQQQVTKW